MRKTLKFLKACKVIAAKYNVAFTKVVEDETNADNVYTELRCDGYVWSSKSKCWIENAREVVAPTAELKRLSVSIRIMSIEDDVAAAVALDYVRAALEDAGAQIYRVNDVKPNHSGDGARAYIEAGL